ncbi:hypothetical protein BH11PLA1_BH11PLA1_08440 [soil metagenome]
MANNACWGVEVGAGGIKAVKLARDGDGVKVLDFAVIPHKRVLSTPEVQERDAKVVAIGQLLGQHNLDKADLAISIPGHSAFAKFAKLPPADPKSIPALVKFEAAQQIPFPIDDVEWDFQTFASPDNPDVEVGIFAVTREKVSEYLSYWTDIGRTPRTLTLAPLAAYNAIAFDQVFTEKTPGTVIIDIGTISTDLIVAEAGRLWIRTFPIGGHQFTEALVTAFNLSYTKAEKLKREAESSPHARHILQAMRPVFADLAQDVQRSLNYYQSLHPEARLTRVIGLGATFNLPGLRKYLSQPLGMEVARLESFQRAKIAGDRDKEFQENSMLLATAYGLALQGLEMQTVTANLMPISVARESAWNAKGKWFATAAALALAAGLALFIGPLRDAAAANAASKPPVIEQVKGDIKRVKGQWTEMDASYKPDYRAAASLGLLSGREIHAMIVSDMGNLVSHLNTDIAKAGKDPKDKWKVKFNRLDTEYVTGGALPSFAPANNSQGGGERGGPISFGGGLGTPTPPVDPTAPPTGGDQLNPRISILLDVDVGAARGDSLAPVTAAVNAWVEEMRKRTGLPYTYAKIIGRDITQTEATMPAAATTPGGSPAPQLPSVPTGGGGGARVPGSGGFGGGTSGEGGGGGGGGGGAAPNAAEIESIAPIPASPPVAAPGAKYTTYRVRLDAVINPPVAAPAGGAK